MANLLQSSAALLINTLKSTSVAGRTVRYERGGEVLLATLNGTCAMHEYEVFEEDGTNTSVTGFDWSFAGGDLLDAASNRFEPHRGDRIIETLNEVEIHYSVLPIAGKPVTEWLDSSGEMVLVRTKRINSKSDDD